MDCQGEEFEYFRIDVDSGVTTSLHMCVSERITPQQAKERNDVLELNKSTERWLRRIDAIPPNIEREMSSGKPHS